LNDKNVTYYDSTGQSEYNFSKPYSEELQKSLILKFHYLLKDSTKELLILENKDKLNQLADILIEKEVIFKDDLEAIFGKRTFDKTKSILNKTLI
jgi:cell division protease FtsH